MITLGTYQAKTHFADLLARVEAGEEIVITRHGRAVARLVPAQQPATRRASTDIVGEFRRIRQAVARRRSRGPSAAALVREGRRR